jgi:hypothetical protein
LRDVIHAQRAMLLRKTVRAVRYGAALRCSCPVPPSTEATPMQVLFYTSPKQHGSQTMRRAVESGNGMQSVAWTTPEQVQG